MRRREPHRLIGDSLVGRVRRVFAMVRDANTFQRAVTRHLILFRRGRKFTMKLAAHSGVSCGFAIPRCRVTARLASPSSMRFASPGSAILKDLPRSPHPTSILVSRSNTISVAEYRLRPKRKYYTDLKKDIPSPEDPQGPSVAGIALSMSLLRAFESRNGVVPSEINIKFEIWGDLEHKAFGEFFNDYRRPIANILVNRKYTFFTSMPFANIDAHKGNDVAKKIALYYQNEVDDENQF